MTWPADPVRFNCEPATDETRFEPHTVKVYAASRRRALVTMDVLVMVLARGLA